MPYLPTMKYLSYQLTNHLDSASVELNETGEIISYEEYHPFGTTSYRSGRSEVEVSLKRYKYVFKELDNETGLYYYGMRYYAGWIAQFISVDPKIHEFPFQTSFAYANNSPIKYIDVNGENAESPDWWITKDKGELIHMPGVKRHDLQGSTNLEYYAPDGAEGYSFSPIGISTNRQTGETTQTKGYETWTKSMITGSPRFNPVLANMYEGQKAFVDNDAFRALTFLLTMPLVMEYGVIKVIRAKFLIGAASDIAGQYVGNQKNNTNRYDLFDSAVSGFENGLNFVPGVGIVSDYLRADIDISLDISNIEKGFDFRSYQLQGRFFSPKPLSAVSTEFVIGRGFNSIKYLNGKGFDNNKFLSKAGVPINIFSEAVARTTSKAVSNELNKSIQNIKLKVPNINDNIFNQYYDMYKRR